jgi:ribosomal protein L29
MKSDEIRKLTAEEIHAKLLDSRHELMNLRPHGNHSQAEW